LLHITSRAIATENQTKMLIKLTVDYVNYQQFERTDTRHRVSLSRRLRGHLSEGITVIGLTPSGHKMATGPFAEG
jgi:hypothetical protein